MTKRSRTVALAIVGAAAFALSGCREEEVDAQAFPNLQACHDAAQNDGLFTTQECDTAFAEAEALHVESAPRYDDLAVCEEQHGEGACGTEAAASSGGSSGIFMPLLTGYLLGSMLGGRGASAAQPLYRTPDGRYTTPSGTSTYSSNNGRSRLGSSLFAKPATTVGQPPMSRAAAVSRGGFGNNAASRGSFGG